MRIALRRRKLNGARFGGLVALVLLAGWVEAGVTPVRLERSETPISVDSNVLFARDPTGRVGIEDRESLDWHGAEAEQGGEFGYTSDAVWARVKIENGLGRAVDARLSLTVARLGRATWWVMNGERIVEVAEEGVDAAEGKGGGRCPSLLVHLPPGERREVFLRVESDTALWISLVLAVGDIRDGRALLRDFSEFSFIGAGGAMFLMALIVGAAQRNRLYLLLAAILGAFMGYYVFFNGYYVMTGGPWQRWANRNLVLALGLAAHGALLEFTVSYLRLSGGAGRSATWLRRISIGMAAGVLVLCVLPFRWGLAAMAALLMVCFAAGLAASFRLALRSRVWPHRLLAGVWLLLALLLATTYAELYAWLPIWMEATYSQRAFLMVFFLMAFTVVAGQRMMERRDRERALLAEQSATVAQLQALRYQLNPHFLYNTLTSIDALSRQAPQRIPDLVRKLATYLRLRLQPSADGMATLEDELKSVRAYLDIEQVRFEESLRVTYEIGLGVDACRVPEMVFQPLVENAVKHGMPSEGALELSIRVARADDGLVIAVENNGQLGSGGSHFRVGGGVGLRNVTERLARVYGDAARFELREGAGRVVAEIRLPNEEGKG